MGAQAGWYGAPGEPGTLRYWSGEAWTDHRQPMPATPPPVVATLAPVAIPAAMLAPVPVLAHAASPDPYAQDQYGSPAQAAAPTSQPASFNLGGFVRLGLNVDGIPVGPNLLSQLPEFAEAGQRVASAAREAQDNARMQPKSTALKGAVKGMVVGLVMIALGVALVLFFSAQSRVGPGEATTQGSVVDHSGIGNSCVPVVGFQVGGQSYRALEGSGGNCGSDIIGEPVDVIYSVANPSQTGRYDFGSPVESFDVVLPLLGVVVFLSGLVTFIRRLFRRRSQFAPGAVAP
jgi:hypothetical protein